MWKKIEDVHKSSYFLAPNHWQYHSKSENLLKMSTKHCWNEVIFLTSFSRLIWSTYFCDKGFEVRLGKNTNHSYYFSNYLDNLRRNRQSGPAFSKIPIYNNVKVASSFASVWPLRVAGVLPSLYPIHTENRAQCTQHTVVEVFSRFGTQRVIFSFSSQI